MFQPRTNVSDKHEFTKLDLKVLRGTDLHHSLENDIALINQYFVCRFYLYF